MRQCLVVLVVQAYAISFTLYLPYSLLVSHGSKLSLKYNNIILKHLLPWEENNYRHNTAFSLLWEYWLLYIRVHLLSNDWSRMQRCCSRLTSSFTFIYVSQCSELNTLVFILKYKHCFQQRELITRSISYVSNGCLLHRHQNIFLTSSPKTSQCYSSCWCTNNQN